MEKIKTLIIILSFLSSILYSNNVNISNVTLLAPDPTTQLVTIQFDISWENSWRISTSPSNWDAVWLFVKFKVDDGVWQHAKLNNSGHTAPSGSILDLGLLNPSSAYNVSTNPSVGAFFYRDAVGTGTFSSSNVQLRWNYGSSGVADDAVVTIKVIGIEMVHINSGSFYLGDQYASGTFARANASNSSPPYNNFYINSATAPTIQGLNSSSSPSNLSAKSALDLGTTTTTATLASGFPNGYNAFYLMKHEISQRQYVEFLNMLTRAQQNSRTETALGEGITSVTNRYVMTNTTSISYRNGISCLAAISSTDPIVFFNDLNGNGIGNESDDGGWIAANYLSWGDFAAYLDWCGLRPITELEYEKSCRGTAIYQKDEYAWGTDTPSPPSSMTYGGQYNESPSSINNNCAMRLESYQIGPFRVGIFANANTNSRRYSGGSFYGVLDLTGNVSELLVAIGEPIGRGFNGSHGNGELNTAGDADVNTWPQTAGYGSGYRGGSWSSFAQDSRVSARLSCGGNNPQSRNKWRGGRGGRTAP